ncbi:hypothetical protein [Flagellimonas sp.]|uniref:hypothetical protein n=1 Tax=Flagellimonas sp. TaxID=2058762 RepID=UPI003AB26C46
MKFHKKVRAGALQFVLFIGAVIAVLLMTFVLLHHTQGLFDKKTSKVVEVIKRADMGIRYAMGEDFQNNSSTTLNLGMDDGIEVTVSKSYWGIFERYTALSRFKKIEFSKITLIGGQLEQNFPALYVKDNDRPIIIAGSAKIIGTVLLPKQGIRPGGISGRFYQYEALVYGQVKESVKTMPYLDSGFRSQLKQLLLNDQIGIQGNELRYKPDLRAINSFESPTQYIFGDVLRFSEGELRGNILVKASSSISIGKGCNIKDVVFMAPKIIVEEGFKGSLQALALDEIQIGKKAYLEYPSALMVDRDDKPYEKSRKAPNILIGEGTTINGVVGYLGNHQENVFYPQISVAEGASIRGEIYCEKSLELKGNVLGKVTTDSFIAMENGSIYQNHLFNGHIDVNGLPEEYGGLLSNAGKTVVKWLY